MVTRFGRYPHVLRDIYGKVRFGRYGAAAFLEQAHFARALENLHIDPSIKLLREAGDKPVDAQQKACEWADAKLPFRGLFEFYENLLRLKLRVQNSQPSCNFRTFALGKADPRRT